MILIFIHNKFLYIPKPKTLFNFNLIKRSTHTKKVGEKIVATLSNKNVPETSVEISPIQTSQTDLQDVAAQCNFIPGTGNPLTESISYYTKPQPNHPDLLQNLHSQKQSTEQDINKAHAHIEQIKTKTHPYTQMPHDTPTAQTITFGLGAAMQSNQQSKDFHRAQHITTQPISSDILIEAKSKSLQGTDNHMPIPNDLYPLMITDGHETSVTQSLPIQKTINSFSDDFADVEHLLATSHGLLSINSTIANDPYAVDTASSLFNNLERISSTNDNHFNKEIKEICEQLVYRGFLKYNTAIHPELEIKVNGRYNGDEVLKKNLQIFIRKINHAQIGIQVSLSEEEFLQKFKINLGLLTTFDQTYTIFLDGIQKHIGLFYVLPDGTNLFYAYLTSDLDKNNIFLSEHQLFSEEEKEQRIHYLKNPLIVKNEHLISLSNEKQIIAQQYFQDEKITNILKTAFLEKIVPLLKEPIYEYNNIGITLNELKNAIIDHDNKQRILAQRWFNEYKSKGFDQEKTTYLENLKKIRNDNIIAYNFLMQLINDKTS